MRLLALLASLVVGGKIALGDTPPLNITALSSRDGYSVLECWQLLSPPVNYLSAVNYALGNTTVATWSRIEPRTTVGEAWAPHVQLSVVLNGLIRITAPAPGCGSTSVPTLCPRNGLASGPRPSEAVAYLMPGTALSSVLIAADLKASSTLAGHFTEFPSDEATILVQIPFVGDKAPTHMILHDGPCM
ncbi:hypothetical protein C8A05DRAFT_16038 [Staphylotrichum tortipilum]|uniref:Uncharacterized protein n=1 Tax=Staphylotrichum tortipilum TaxID=2831512 RepID=A0AAN6RSI6_9PEZI|nr:hypothetical protein C8A05DRAFT_16038 [Staphylotrichum longicolle]